MDSFAQFYPTRRTAFTLLRRSVVRLKAESYSMVPSLASVVIHQSDTVRRLNIFRPLHFKTLQCRFVTTCKS
jgi:hypothetical protein